MSNKRAYIEYKNMFLLPLIEESAKNNEALIKIEEDE